MKLNEKILYYRKRAGLSQEALAAKIGVSRQAVSKWEVGDTVPELDKLVALAKTFGVTTDELLGMEEPTREAEQAAPQPSRLPEDVDWVVRRSAKFRRWYAPIYVGPVMLIVGIYGCITDWHIYELVPYMWQSTLLSFCASAALAAFGAGAVIWGVVRLVRHRREEKKKSDQDRAQPPGRPA